MTAKEIFLALLEDDVVPLHHKDKDHEVVYGTNKILDCGLTPSGEDLFPEKHDEVEEVLPEIKNLWEDIDGVDNSIRSVMVWGGKESRVFDAATQMLDEIAQKFEDRGCPGYKLIRQIFEESGVADSIRRRTYCVVKGTTSRELFDPVRKIYRDAVK